MNPKEAILEKIHAVPTMPAAALRVIELLESPEVEIGELLDTIEYDPGLTSNILRLANSAYFGCPRSIGSLREAIVRLGLKRIEQLVFTAAVSPMTRPRLEGYGLQAGDLFRHSVSVAIGTEEFAKALNMTEAPSYAFTAGLLHELGKVVLGTFIEIDTNPIMERIAGGDIAFNKAEQEVLGIDHAEVGAILLDAWRLPQDIVDVVRWHHEPDRLEPPNAVCDLVHAADILSMSAGVGIGIDGLNYMISETAITRLGLTTDTTEIVMGIVLTTLEEFDKAVLATT